jgi:hypothetical protein
MKTIKNFFLLLLGMMIPMLTANCSDKKSAEKTNAIETTKTKDAFEVNFTRFDKFVQVTKDNVKLYKETDTNSPTLVRWDQDRLEGERDENSTFYQWSGQPGKPDYEKTTDIVYNGEILAVVGEEGDFYKAYICDKKIESAYIQKSDVKEIKSAPVTADIVEGPDWFRGIEGYIVKEGKYKDVIMYVTGGERSLTGHELHVGILTDCIVVMPDNYFIDCREMEEQTEPVAFKEEDGHIFLDYNKSAMHEYHIDPKKLSEDNIAKIVEIVTKNEPKGMECQYYFPSETSDKLFPFYFK